MSQTSERRRSPEPIASALENTLRGAADRCESASVDTKLLEETVRVIARLFDHYGIDRSLNRDRSLDGERFQQALYLAARDGLLRLPPNQGAPRKWTGSLGLELIKAVEASRTGAVPAPSVTKAIEALREQYPDKWGVYDSDYLQKRFYEAKRFWSLGHRLMVLSDRWHEDHHMFSPRRHTKKS